MTIIRKKICKYIFAKEGKKRIREKFEGLFTVALIHTSDGICISTSEGYVELFILDFSRRKKSNPNIFLNVKNRYMFMNTSEIIL